MNENMMGKCLRQVIKYTTLSKQDSPSRLRSQVK